MEVGNLALLSCFQDIIQGAENLNPESDVLENLPSFRQACLLPGDLMLTPPGVMTVEKMINSHSMGIRANMHLLHAKCLESITCLDFLCPGILGVF